MSNSLHKTASISIEGTHIKAFRTLLITQSVHSYHQFELNFEYQQLEDQFTFDAGSKKSLVGKNINIIIEGEAADMAKLEFDGVIAEAELFQNDKAFLGSIVVRGHGLPYKLDTVPGISAYYDMSVTDVVSKCLSAYASPKSVSAPVGPTHTLPFAVRYRETYWNFLRRLAYDYGAWLYYDGQKLHFTSTLGGSAVPLTFGLNLHNLRSGTRAVPQFVSQYDYLALDDDTSMGEGTANAALFASMAESPQTGRRAVAAADVGKFAKNRSAAYGADSSYVTGESDVPGISVGTLVRINDQRSGGSLGDFHVVEVTHRIDKAQRYHNSFRAIPATVKVMPMGPLHQPVAEPQLATVVDNKDPRKLGRVQVQLQWMKASEKTPWLRVLAPHYGLDAKRQKSRGFLFVPEVKDQVMVGFQHGDPERPFVFGAMPHGKNAAVPDPAVQEHHLSVNSGTTVTFLDTQTKHELHLQVDKENLLTIVVDSGQGTITLNASKAIVLKATQEITLDAPKIAITGDNVSIKGTAKVAIAGAQIDLKADAELKEAGATVKITGTGMATLESSGMTTVKGTIVMIN
jgi:uncharacterized protein involved in type VI secretion and phage assembly